MNVEEIIKNIVILLLISCVGVVISRRIKYPYTIVLVFIGLIISIVPNNINIHLDHHLILQILVPPLLFYGALHIDLEELKKNGFGIFLLSIFGVILSVFGIGYIFSILSNIPLKYTLLLGAIIVPTDPISVLSILKEAKTPKDLQVLLEGESLFNDGVSIVIFTIIYSFILGETTDLTIISSIVGFLKIAGGGIIIGFMCGFISYYILKKINDHLLEVSLTVVLVFGTPLLAEYFHMSGIIAIVVAGLIMGNYGRIYSMKQKTRETLDTFWEVIDFIINSILFLALGLQLKGILSKIDINYLNIVQIILIMLFIRAVVVYSLMGIKNRIGFNKIPFKWSHIIFWGGLRGAISLAMVLSLPNSFIYRQQFIIFTFSIIIFSLFVQGLTIKGLVRRVIK